MPASTSVSSVWRVLERYSPSARRAVDLAAVEARRLGHPHVGTEHLLLGVLAEGHNPAARLLHAAGAPLAACREKVSEALARRDLPAPERGGADLELTDRAARAMDRAGKLSLRMKSEEVRTAHLMVSVLDVEGTAGQVLRGLNVDLGALREDLAGATGSESWSEVASGEVASGEGAAVVGQEAAGGVVTDYVGPEPVCATCGKPLRATLSNMVLTSDSGAEFEVVYCSSCGAGLGAARVG